MALRFQAGTQGGKADAAVKNAIESVMRAPFSPQRLQHVQLLSELAHHYDCESEIRKALYHVARELLQHRITFSDYIREPWLLRKIALRQAVSEFYDVLTEYLHVQGEAVGQRLLLHMDEMLAAYLQQQHEGMIRSA